LDIGVFDIADSFINKGYKKVKEALKDYKDFFVLHNDLDSYTIQGTLE
jgi:hypothetical protein